MRYSIVGSIAAILVGGLLCLGCGSSSGSSSGTAPVNSGGGTAPVATISIVNTGLPTGQVGVAYDATLLAQGGTAPYTWGTQSNQPLPSGLVLDPQTGRITGMPTAAGQFVVGFTVVDSGVNPSQGTARDLTLNVQ